MASGKISKILQQITFTDKSGNTQHAQTVVLDNNEWAVVGSGQVGDMVLAPYVSGDAAKVSDWTSRLNGYKSVSNSDGSGASAPTTPDGYSRVSDYMPTARPIAPGSPKPKPISVDEEANILQAAGGIPDQTLIDINASAKIASPGLQTTLGTAGNILAAVAGPAHLKEAVLTGDVNPLGIAGDAALFVVPGGKALGALGKGVVAGAKSVRAGEGASGAVGAGRAAFGAGKGATVAAETTTTGGRAGVAESGIDPFTGKYVGATKTSETATVAAETTTTGGRAGVAESGIDPFTGKYTGKTGASTEAGKVEGGGAPGYKVTDSRASTALAAEEEVGKRLMPGTRIVQRDTGDIFEITGVRETRNGRRVNLESVTGTKRRITLKPEDLQSKLAAEDGAWTWSKGGTTATTPASSAGEGTTATGRGGVADSGIDPWTGKYTGKTGAKTGTGEADAAGAPAYKTTDRRASTALAEEEAAAAGTAPAKAAAVHTSESTATGGRAGVADSGIDPWTGKYTGTTKSGTATTSEAGATTKPYKVTDNRASTVLAAEEAAGSATSAESLLSHLTGKFSALSAVERAGAAGTAIKKEVGAIVDKFPSLTTSSTGKKAALVFGVTGGAGLAAIALTVDEGGESSGGGAPASPAGDTGLVAGSGSGGVWSAIKKFADPETLQKETSPTSTSTPSKIGNYAGAGIPFITSTPPRAGGFGGSGTKATPVSITPKPTVEKTVLVSNGYMGATPKNPAAFVPQAGARQIARVTQDPTTGVTTTTLLDGSIYTQKQGTPSAYKSKGPDVFSGPGIVPPNIQTESMPASATPKPVQDPKNTYEHVSGWFGGGGGNTPDPADTPKNAPGYGAATNDQWAKYGADIASAQPAETSKNTPGYGAATNLDWAKYGTAMAAGTGNLSDAHTDKSYAKPVKVEYLANGSRLTTTESGAVIQTTAAGNSYTVKKADPSYNAKPNVTVQGPPFTGPDPVDPFARDYATGPTATAPSATDNKTPGSSTVTAPTIGGGFAPAVVHSANAAPASVTAAAPATTDPTYPFMSDFEPGQTQPALGTKTSGYTYTTKNGVAGWYDNIKDLGGQGVQYPGTKPDTTLPVQATSTSTSVASTPLEPVKAAVFPAPVSFKPTVIAPTFGGSASDVAPHSNFAQPSAPAIPQQQPDAIALAAQQAADNAKQVAAAEKIKQEKEAAQALEAKTRSEENARRIAVETQQENKRKEDVAKSAAAAAAEEQRKQQAALAASVAAAQKEQSELYALSAAKSITAIPGMPSAPEIKALPSFMTETANTPDIKQVGNRFTYGHGHME